MRLLILTQKVDRNDPVLGFFHRWIEEFAKHCEQVTVVALGVGEYDLPQNVHVFSLGKESGASRFKYIFNFYRLIWRERKNYDAVFVHMNQEYVLLGGPLWKLLGKKVTMWRNHAKGGLATRTAVLFSDKVFCTSPHSFTARFKRARIVPVGIDTSNFRHNEMIPRAGRSILFLGRISPVKNIDICVKALNILDEKNIGFIANIYGGSSEKDKGYYEKIKAQAVGLVKKGKVSFGDAVPNEQALMLYNQHEVFVNATPKGSLDKTIFEAMACECVIVASNESLRGDIPEEFLFKDCDEYSLAESLQKALLLSSQEKNKIGLSMRTVSLRHDLSILIESILSFENKT